MVYDVALAARRTRDIEDQVRYVNERAGLQGTEVVTKNKSASPVTWTVTDVEDSTKIINNDQEDLQEIGLTGFDFRRFEMSDRAGRSNRRINFMKLLFALWPGNVHHQLLVLNGRIEEDNKGRARNRVLPISLHEFGHFLGVMLIARLEGKDGSALWHSNPALSKKDTAPTLTCPDT